VKTKYVTAKLVVVAVVSAVLVLISLKAGGGSLEPPGPPGSPEASMPSLSEIYAASSGTNPPPLPLAFDGFLKIDSIPGESTDDKHKDWIEILSFSHGVSQPATVVGGTTTERCQHQDFSLVKTLDKASPKLALSCSEGEHIKEVRIELCRATGDKQKYMEYKLSDVIVSSVNPSAGTMSGQDRPIEEVSFNYGKIEWTYTIIGADGLPAGNVIAQWDLMANKGS
jgi:type VI secretion system secreted protein Hcp